jgi:hypothetical protein
LKYRHYLNVAVVMVLMTGLITIESQATTVLPLNLQKLVDISSSVIVGHVVNVHTEGQLKPRKIETVIQIEVDECLIGPCKPTLILRQLGGMYDFIDGRFTQSVPGMPQYKIGERVVLFLEETDTKRLVVTGLAQGKFSVSDESESASLSRDLGGLHFVDASTKQPVDVGGLNVMSTRLDALKVSLKKGRSVIDLRPTIVQETVRGGVQ